MTDALGTPVAVSDEAWNVVERSEYEPYGKVLNRPLQDAPGYTGHVEDKSTGLTYAQQRYLENRGQSTFLALPPSSKPEEELR